MSRPNSLDAVPPGNEDSTPPPRSEALNPILTRDDMQRFQSASHIESQPSGLPSLQFTGDNSSSSPISGVPPIDQSLPSQRPDGQPGPIPAVHPVPGSSQRSSSATPDGAQSKLPTVDDFLRIAQEAHSAGDWTLADWAVEQAVDLANQDVKSEVPGRRPGHEGERAGTADRPAQSGAIQPAEGPVRPGERPAQPGVVQAAAEPVRPGERPAQPGVVQAAAEPVRPGERPAQPGVVQAAAEPVRPGERPAQPGVVQPAAAGPTDRPAQPGPARPEERAAQPDQATRAPGGNPFRAGQAVTYDGRTWNVAGTVSDGGTDFVVIRNPETSSQPGFTRPLRGEVDPKLFQPISIAGQDSKTQYYRHRDTSQVVAVRTDSQGVRTASLDPDLRSVRSDAVTRLPQDVPAPRRATAPVDREALPGGIRRGQEVTYLGEQGTAAGTLKHNNQDMILFYQPNKDPGNRFQFADGPPDPGRFSEIIIPNQPASTKYYRQADSTQLYTSVDLPNGKRLFGPVANLTMAPAQAVSVAGARPAGAPRPGGEAPPRVEAPRQGDRPAPVGGPRPIESPPRPADARPIPSPRPVEAGPAAQPQRHVPPEDALPGGFHRGQSVTYKGEQGQAVGTVRHGNQDMVLVHQPDQRGGMRVRQVGDPDPKQWTEVKFPNQPEDRRFFRSATSPSDQIFCLSTGADGVGRFGPTPALKMVPPRELAPAAPVQAPAPRPERAQELPGGVRQGERVSYNDHNTWEARGALSVGNENHLVLFDPTRAQQANVLIPIDSLPDARQFTEVSFDRQSQGLRYFRNNTTGDVSMVAEIGGQLKMGRANDVVVVPTNKVSRERQEVRAPGDGPLQPGQRAAQVEELPGGLKLGERVSVNDQHAWEARGVVPGTENLVILHDPTRAQNAGMLNNIDAFPHSSNFTEISFDGQLDGQRYFRNNTTGSINMVVEVAGQLKMGRATDVIAVPTNAIKKQPQEAGRQPTDGQRPGEAPDRRRPSDYRVRIGNFDAEIKPGEQVRVGSQQVGVNGIRAHHATIGRDERGLYLINHANSESSSDSHSTGVKRDGRWYTLGQGDRVYLSEVDSIELRSTTARVGLQSSQLSAPRSPVPTVPDTWVPSGDGRRQSSDYAERHRMSARIEDGFQNAGDRQFFDRRGQFYDIDGGRLGLTRPSTVVDFKDPALQAVMKEAEQIASRFDTSTPQGQHDLAEALIKLSNDRLTPPGGDPELNTWYDWFTKENAGKRISLGEHLRMGKGVCSQQALLAKVLCDHVGLEGIDLVRGHYRGSGERVSAGSRSNHAWLERREGNSVVRLDPRGRSVVTSADQSHSRYTPAENLPYYQTERAEREAARRLVSHMNLTLRPPEGQPGSGGLNTEIRQRDVGQDGVVRESTGPADRQSRIGGSDTNGRRELTQQDINGIRQDREKMRASTDPAIQRAGEALDPILRDLEHPQAAVRETAHRNLLEASRGLRRVPGAALSTAVTVGFMTVAALHMWESGSQNSDHYVAPRVRNRKP